MRRFIFVVLIGASAVAVGVSHGGAEPLPSENNSSATSESIEAGPPEAPERRSGGSFGGAFAYDYSVGYDFGAADDNGYAADRYLNNRGRQKRMPGKRSDPGDVDFADFYYDRNLRSGPPASDTENTAARTDLFGQQGQREYWQASRHIPLFYDDTREYLRFRYDLGGP